MTNRPRHIEPSLIATLDILGATSMMTNARKDELIELASHLEQAFTNTTRDVSEIIKALNETSRKGLEIGKSLRTRVFSDTIVVSCDFTTVIKKVPLVDRMACPEYLLLIYGFFLCVKHIASELFYSGYPTRGCVAAGPIISTKNFIVGKPFVEAMAISKDLNLAGVVLTNPAKQIYDIIAHDLKTLAKDVPIERHYIHCKSNKRKQLNCINFLNSTKDRFLISDIASIFSSHGKKIDHSVQLKINNTQKLLMSFLRHLKKRNNHH